VVIGAGISGVSFGRLLQLAGFEDFVILEAQGSPGGLCRSQRIDGHVLDIGGGHFLCTRYSEVYDFIFSHIGKSEFHEFGRRSKVCIDDTYVDYPLEYNLWQLPDATCRKYLASLTEGGDGEAPPANYEMWTRQRLGQRIAEDYMLPYNLKIWGVPPSRLDIDWLHKVPPVDVAAIVASCRNRRAPDGVMPSHARFYYPRHGGFQAIFDALLAPVRAHVLTDSRVVKLQRTSRGWLVNDEFKAGLVVNTAPWPLLADALADELDVENAFAKLTAAGIVVSLWTREHERDWHWLYDPRPDVEEHRQFFIGNFALDSRADGVYTETNVRRWPGWGGSWSSGETPVHENVNEYAYPIPLIGSAAAVADVHEYLARQGLIGLGRWGQWQYLNADVCILESMKLAHRLGFQWPSAGSL
jgi:protoporphyrinogen oxidase